MFMSEDELNEQRKLGRPEEEDPKQREYISFRKSVIKAHGGWAAIRRICYEAVKNHPNTPKHEE